MKMVRGTTGKREQIAITYNYWHEFAYGANALVEGNC